MHALLRVSKLLTLYPESNSKCVSRYGEEIIHDIFLLEVESMWIHSVLSSVLHIIHTIYHSCMQPCIVSMQAEDTTSSVLY